MALLPRLPSAGNLCNDQRYTLSGKEEPPTRGAVCELGGKGCRGIPINRADSPVPTRRHQKERNPIQRPGHQISVPPSGNGSSSWAIYRFASSRTRDNAGHLPPFSPTLHTTYATKAAITTPPGFAVTANRRSDASVRRDQTPPPGPNPACYFSASSRRTLSRYFSRMTGTWSGVTSA